MADVLIYWRDYAANGAYQFSGDRAFYWHSSAKCIAELQPGDRMWMVTSGKGLREDAEQAAFLVGVWVVRNAVRHPGLLLRVLRQGEAAIAGPAQPAG